MDIVPAVSKLNLITLKREEADMNRLIIGTALALALVACKPSAPVGPDADAYGKTIQPFHQIPDSAQEGGGKVRTLEE